jgi:hypothetical protein
MHGGKSWDKITALITGRTNCQHSSRWYRFLDPNIDRAHGRTDTWTEDEDIMLKDAVQMHGVARIGVQLPRWSRVQ